jgi:hypothetical protein
MLQCCEYDGKIYLFLSSIAVGTIFRALFSAPSRVAEANHQLQLELLKLPDEVIFLYLTFS